MHGLIFFRVKPIYPTCMPREKIDDLLSIMGPLNIINHDDEDVVFVSSITNQIYCVYLSQIKKTDIT